jgi:hypothetical protein
VATIFPKICKFWEEHTQSLEEFRMALRVDEFILKDLQDQLEACTVPYMTQSLTNAPQKIQKWFPLR